MWSLSSSLQSPTILTQNCIRRGGGNNLRVIYLTACASFVILITFDEERKKKLKICWKLLFVSPLLYNMRMSIQPLKYLDKPHKQLLRSTVSLAVALSLYLFIFYLFIVFFFFFHSIVSFVENNGNVPPVGDSNANRSQKHVVLQMLTAKA